MTLSEACVVVARHQLELAQLELLTDDGVRERVVVIACARLHDCDGKVLTPYNPTLDEMTRTEWEITIPDVIPPLSAAP